MLVPPPCVLGHTVDKDNGRCHFDRKGEIFLGLLALPRLSTKFAQGEGIQSSSIYCAFRPYERFVLYVVNFLL